jgi:hypothetical protein
MPAKIVAVDQQALLDAIDSRMSKVGVDHDLLTSMNGKLDRLIESNVDHEVRIRLIETKATKTEEHIVDMDADIEANKRNTNLWGGGNLMAMIGAFIAAYFHRP